MAPASSRRRWLFRGVVLVLPWLALFLLEVALRLSGCGVSMDFVTRQRVGGEPRLLANPRFTWLFFDPAVARVASPFSLAVRKPPNTVRVVVLGSSAAQGDPEPGLGVARLLEVLLAARYPGTSFEVTNAAATAVNSHYVYAATAESLALEPDVLVLYTGNNEVVGPYGAGTVLTASAPPASLVRAAVAAQRTRVGQLVRRVLRPRGAAGVPGAWHGMEMFLEQQVRQGDPRLARSYRNYATNIADACRLARRARVPLVLSTVAVNLRDCGPFASVHGGALSAAQRARFDALLGDAGRLARESRWSESVEALLEATGLDREHAGASYLLARAELAAGRHEEARRHFALARDLDALRFRADTRTNAIVREVATRERVTLVDAERVVGEGSPGGVPGAESFLDHVHLTFHGNYLLASALAEAIGPILPDEVRTRGSREQLGETEVARRLVYSELDRFRIAETMRQRLREAPFTNQPDHAEQVARFDSELALLRAQGSGAAVTAALAQYERALGAGGAHWSLRERYAVNARRAGDFAVAVREFEALAAEFPAYPGFQLQLSRALRDLGKLTEARAALHNVLDYHEDAPTTLVELARLELADGRSGPAETAARRAVALDPRDANALNVLAASLCPRRQCTPTRRAEALRLLDRAVELAPESEVSRRERDLLRDVQAPSR